MSELENFLQEISPETQSQETTAPAETTEEVVEEKAEEIVPFHKDERFRKARQERREALEKAERLEKELADERSKKPNVTVNDDEFVNDWKSTFGDTEESQAQLKFFAKYLNGLDEKAAAKAMEKIQSEMAEKTQKETAEEERWNYQVQSQLEELEESYGIDLTSGSKEAETKRAEFFSFVTELSPKDTQGNVLQYVPFDKAYQLWAKDAPKDNTERKQIASRSMDKATKEAPKTFVQPDFRNDDWRSWAQKNGMDINNQLTN